MKHLIITLLVLCPFVIMAQNQTFNLYPGKAPNQLKELIEYKDTAGRLVDGTSVIRLKNVSTPTITIYKAEKPCKDNKTIIVTPGGGYQILAWNLEGTEICEYLNSIGVNAVLLKHRIPRREGSQKHAAALEDIQRAIAMVRGQAEEFGLNPNMIGVMGFSAGAHLSVMASTAYHTKVNPAIDQFDTIDIKPNFCILIYPAYLDGEKPFTLAEEVKPSPETPPTFIAQAQNDTRYINSSIFYAYHLKELKVPLTYHMYSEGGHGHGLRQRDLSVNRWPEDLRVWLEKVETYKK